MQTARAAVTGRAPSPAGRERYESFLDGRSGRVALSYEYRTAGGEVFSTVARCLQIARQRRDSWLRRRARKRR